MGGWPYVFSRSCSLLSKYLPISLKQRKEQSHSQCHVKHRIRIFHKISEHVTIPKFQYRLILLSQWMPLHTPRTLFMTSLSCGEAGNKNISTSSLQSIGSSNWGFCIGVVSKSSFAVWGNIEVLFRAIYQACFIHWLLLLEQALGLENEHSKGTFKQIIIFNRYINLRASFNWEKFSALNVDWILIALMFMWFQNLFGALGLSGAVSFKNFFPRQ